MVTVTYKVSASEDTEIMIVGQLRWALATYDQRRRSNFVAISIITWRDDSFLADQRHLSMTRKGTENGKRAPCNEMSHQ